MWSDGAFTHSEIVDIRMEMEFLNDTDSIDQELYSLLASGTIIILHTW